MTEMEFPLVALFRPKPENYQLVLDFLTTITPEVHLEPGCLLYALHETKDGRLVFVEKWKTRSDWVKHSEAESVQKINSFIEGKLLEPVDVIELIPAPAGITTRGIF
jgi:quinol monooxygenase YgiN